MAPSPANGGAAILRRETASAFQELKIAMLFTSRTAKLAALIALLFLAGALGWLFLLAAVVADLALLLAVLVDLQLTPAEEGVEARRHVDATLTLAEENPVSVSLWNRTGFPARVIMRDEAPVEILRERPTLEFDLLTNGEATASYLLKPFVRGEYRFGDLNVRRLGRLGLIVRQWRVPAEQAVKVYPNVAAARRYSSTALMRRYQETGARLLRNPGAGREFSAMRDYLPDDEFRSIDWKATARRVRLTARQYEIERSQQVVCCLDTGRLMGQPAGVMTKLDYAINAALVLAYVCVAAGDRAGLFAFAETAIAFVPPDRSQAQLNRFLEALYPLRASASDPSFLDARLQLGTRLRRRGLLIFITDLTDPNAAAGAARHLGALALRHVVLCVAIQDPETARLAQAAPREEPDVYRQAVATLTLADRQRALARLKQAGVLVLDVLPERLSAQMVERYLALKAAGRL